MRRPALAAVSVLTLLLVAPAGSQAGPGAPLDLSRARTVASPGAPEAVHVHLPGGRAPEALARPLPPGPLLVLGLPGQDDVAEDLALLLGLLSPGEDLGGGYLRAAWHDGNRPVVVLLAEDPVALLAAVQALDPADPARAARVPSGIERFRPAYRTRALWPAAGLDRPCGDLAQSVRDAIAARATEVWLDLAHGERPVEQVLPVLRRHGVAGVVLVDAAASDTAASVAARLAPWQARHGVRRFVVRQRDADPQRDGGPLSRLAGLTDLLAQAGPVDALYAPGDGGTRSGTIHDLVNDAAPLEWDTTALGWSGREPPRWVLPARPPRPSAPRRGSGPAGVLVVADAWARVLLEEAWTGPTQAPGAWETTLRPLLPRGSSDPIAFLRESTRRLSEAAGSPAPPPWMDALAVHLASTARRLPADALLVPHVPAPVRVDGRLDERAWRWAARVEFAVPLGDEWAPGDVLLLADGWHVVVGLRAPARLLPLEVELEREDGEARVARSLVATGEGAPSAPQGGAAQDEGRRVRWEQSFPIHATLGGGAWPTRVFTLRIRAQGGRVVLHEGVVVLGP